ncbi:hypothetical protein [Streptomyces sp. NPDC087300]|uniref:hypothetical protein n=1 Tax=Streptomyces sp. NPDC087300 TaxID=3365780 RepID=UPI003822BFE5
MGLHLYPNDDEVTSPDISWSYSGFRMFREWLAQAEGFVLAEMRGHDGNRPWSDVTTTLEPLLHHADDDGPDLAPDQCAAMLPRLRAIADERRSDAADPVVGRRVDDTRQLITVMEFCVAEDLPLVFG